VATYVKYETAIEKLCNKLIDAFGTTDTWRVVIATDAPTASTDSTISDITQIAANNGYPGTNDIAFNSTRSGATVTATATDVVWTASGGNLGSSTTGRYIIMYDDTSAADDLWAYWDYGTTFTVATGETFTVDFGASVFTIA
jgi:hypothetical protein